LSFDAQAGSGEVAVAPAADDGAAAEDEVVADDGAAADDTTVDDATAEDDTEEVEVCTTKRVKKSKL